MRKAILIFFAAGLAFAAAPQSKPPNVLLITIDTLRADHLSCYGYGWKTSPQIDQLAAEGVRFDRAYTVIPLTGPAHLSLFTSRYPQEHGARRNGEAMVDERPLVVLPKVLRANGYRTAGFISGWPLNGRLTHINEWFDHYDENLNRTYQLFNSSRWAEDVTPPAINWLKGNAGKEGPFFLWVHYFDPHSPYDFRKHFANLAPTGENAPAAVADPDMRERIRNYDTEIAYMDWHIGKLFAALDELGVRDSTLIALTADHGESLGEHDYVGHGRQLYESILRVPLIVRLPGKVAAGKVVDIPVSLLDIAPTLVDLTVRDKLDERKTPLTFAGRSLVPALTGDERLTSRRQYYVTFAGKKGFAPKWLSWVWVSEEDLPLRFGYLEGARKMIWSPEDDALMIFDVSRDPAELKPERIEEGNARYTAATKPLQSWYSKTAVQGGEQRLSARDLEVLKSLGYVQ